MRLYNFPFEVKVRGKAMFPTAVKLPEWARDARYRNAVAEMVVQEVRRVGDYTEEGLEKPLWSPDAPSTMDWNTIEAWMKEIAPIEEEQIVEWMQTAAAANVIISAREEEYKKLGSSLVGNSDDAYIPGLSVEDVRFRPELGRTVASRGYAVMETPRGNVDVSVPGKATGIFRDLLCWGACLDAYLVQWTGVLLKWRELTTNPSGDLGFPNFRGLVAPQFFAHSSSIPAPVNMVTMRVCSDKPQTISIRGRSVDDYRDVILEQNISVPEGESEVSFYIFGFPVVPVMAVEMQPEDGTKTVLRKWEVLP